MAELIVTIPNTRAGNIAIEHLRSRATNVGGRYVTSLREYLHDTNAARYLERLPFSFHLVATEDGQESAVTTRILRWHSNETADYPHGRVESVEPNLALYTQALGLPFQLGNDHSAYLSQMRVHEAHRNNVRGAGVHVAILDTGLDPGATPKARDFFDVEDVKNLHPPAPIDNDGHGTAMAELVHAVAPDAEIYAIRVLDTGRLNLWNLMGGIGIAVADCDADIVNLSVGYSSMMKLCPGCGAPVGVRSLAFEKLTDTGIPSTGKLPVYVAATGNDSLVSHFDFPASSERCVAVGAVDSAQQRSFFSNYGINHRRYLMAPGGQEVPPAGYSEAVGTGGGINACAGTSVSVAYVSGMLALFRSDARYVTLGRDGFIDSILSNHCLLPVHAQNKPTEYGSGIIEYSSPAFGSAAPDDSSRMAASQVWVDGDFVYVGGIRLKINRRY